MCTKYTLHSWRPRRPPTLPALTYSLIPPSFALYFSPSHHTGFPLCQTTPRRSPAAKLISSSKMSSVSAGGTMALLYFGAISIPSIATARQWITRHRQQRLSTKVTDGCIWTCTAIAEVQCGMMLADLHHQKNLQKEFHISDNEALSKAINTQYFKVGQASVHFERAL